MFFTPFQGSESCSLFQGPSNLPVDLLDLTDEPHPRFPVPGHILSVGGDPLRWDNGSIKSHEKRSQASHSCKRFLCLFQGTFEGLFGGGTTGHTVSTDLTRQQGHQIPGKHLTKLHPGNSFWCLIQELLKAFS